MIRFYFAPALVLLVLCALSLPAFADIPDPHVIINDPPGSCMDLNSLSIDFTTDDMGNANVCFTNQSGVDFFEVEFILKYPMVVNQLVCGGNAFSNCAVEVEGGFTTLEFSGGLIADGMTFTVDVMGFKPNAAFHGDANQEPQPEPATLVLLASGIAATAARGWRKFS